MLDKLIVIPVTIGGMATKPWTDPTFQNYGTVAFDRDFMMRLIGFGSALVDSRTREFIRFGVDSRPGEDVAGTPMPVTALNLEMWQSFVPRVYLEELDGLAEELWRQFGQEAIRGPMVARIVEAMRRWIGTNVEPTRSHLTRRQRFANAWGLIGIKAAHDLGLITYADAHEAMWDFEDC